jgi:hypothetical protein
MWVPLSHLTTHASLKGQLEYLENLLDLMASVTLGHSEPAVAGLHALGLSAEVSAACGGGGGGGGRLSRGTSLCVLRDDAACCG